jgi:uncharacterized protein YecT (DUF1311 family)
MRLIMRTILLACCGAIAIAGCSQAAGPDGSLSMPMLSAANTIEACFQQNPEEAARSANCIGQYSPASIRLSPDGETSSGMLRCTSQEYQAWNARLNSTYEQLRSSLDPDQADGLQAAQQAWIGLRDADCGVVPPAYDAGSTQPLLHEQCLLGYAARRTIRLASDLAGH